MTDEEERNENDLPKYLRADSSLEEAYDDFFDRHLIETQDGKIMQDRRFARVGELLLKDILSQSDETVGWIVESMTLLRLYNEIIELVEESQQLGDERGLRIATADSVLLFHTLAHEMIQGIMGDILNQTLVSDDRRDSASLKFARNIDSELKEDLLYYSGVTDSGLKGEIANVRRTRNKLVHDLRQRHYLNSVENVKSRLDRVIKTVNALHEYAYGHEPLPY